MGSLRPARLLDIDGCFNFRDLGGYRTDDGLTMRWRTLFRSDSLHRTTTVGSVAFRRLGIVTAVDLRTPPEVEEGRWQPPRGWAGRWVHVPLMTETPDWTNEDRAKLEAITFAADHYLEIATAGATALRAVIEALARPGALPAVFYCAAGKDRTGVLAALVMRLIGVRISDIADDYALSAVATARWERAVRAGRPNDTQVAWPYMPPTIRRSDPRTMLTFLRNIDRDHGSVSGFAEHLGMAPDTVTRLRSVLLEP
jgi:protein-tyrosine phosphatase